MRVKSLKNVEEAMREKQSSHLPLLRKNPGTVSPKNGTTGDYDLRQIKREVNRHINGMRKNLSSKVKETVQYLERHDAANNGRQQLQQLDGMAVKRLIGNRMPDYNFYETVVQNDLENHIDSLFRRRQDDGEDEAEDDNKNGGDTVVSVDFDNSKEDGSESESQEEAPGGLVGLIAGLSGGDEGSDVGALVGAISAAVTNLFGPDGLDIPGLLGTGTGLIAGLLGGDENFGKVLGSYVGIAIEGFSGGGADPEDEDLPLRPELFINNFLSGLKEAKRKGDPAAEHTGSKGSDLFGFIGNIVSSIVGGVTSLVLNASLGSSGGSSQGSVDASAALSGGSSSGSSAASNDCHMPCSSDNTL
ncbi:uncharacterized protein LOC129760749 [Uranotaenia lowii]|uniref:uncharacterized protein LOC129760749 n=1 Tax=Uranotaenia lowii TaxID=190385 RepID=UPI00247A5CB8|nr:uncharacterized protein LOC129760749 [Uranotaenia lowii]